MGLQRKRGTTKRIGMYSLESALAGLEISLEIEKGKENYHGEGST
jgi:hypothetical protein